MTGPTTPPQSPPESAGWRNPINVGFALVAGLVLVLLVLIYRPLVRPLLWAAALATLVYPAHRRVLDVVRGRATLAAAISTAFWIAVLVVPAIFAVSQVVVEAQDLWPRITQQLGTAPFARLATALETSPFRAPLHFVLELPRGADATALEERIKTGVDTFGSFVLVSARHFTVGAPGVLVRVMITIVTFFFFLRQGPGWVQRLRDGLPLEPVAASALLNTVARTVGAVFRGVLLTAAAQAALATLGYVVAGAPVPLLLGFLTLIGALLPFVGPVAVWLPTAIGLYLADRTAQAIGLAIWGVLVVSLVDNFLRPYLIGRDARLPLLWMFLAILGGLQAFGFLGLLLGPAALALFLACYRIYVQSRRANAEPTFTDG